MSADIQQVFDAAQHGRRMFVEVSVEGGPDTMAVAAIHDHEAQLLEADTDDRLDTVVSSALIEYQAERSEVMLLALIRAWRRMGDVVEPIAQALRGPVGGSAV